MLPSLRVLPVVLVVVVFLGVVSAASAEDTVAASLVRLTADVDGKTRFGTGFIVAVDNDVAYILTAKHVVVGTQYPDVDFTIDPSQTHRGEVMQNDPQEDLTVLRVVDPPDGVQPLAIAKDSAVVRDTVLLIGFPSRAPKPHYRASAVSSLDGTRLILDRKVLPGDSGGPVLKHDEIVGLVVSKRQGREDFAKAIPRSTLVLALESWLEGVDLPKPRGTVERHLSFTITDIENIPLPDLHLARGEHVSPPTSSTGYSTILATADDEAGSAISDLLFPAPLASEWMLLSKRVHVPSEDEPGIHLIAMKRSDFRKLASGALDAVSSAPLQGDSPSQESKRAIIAEFAREQGLSEEQLRQAIEAFGETSNLLDRGIAELLAQNYSTASEILQKSVEEGRAKIDDGQYQVAESSLHLGRSLRFEGKYRESVAAYREALKYRSDDPSLLSELGIALLHAGEFREAENVVRRAIELYSKSRDEEHPETLTVRLNLALTLEGQGDLTSAVVLQRSVLETSERLLGQEHSLTLAARNNLAHTLQAQGSLSGAAELERSVLEASERRLGPEHPQTLAARNNLADTLFAQGNLSGAAELQRSVLEASERVLGQEHPQTLAARNNLAHTLFAQGNLPGAAELQRSVLEASERVLGQEHPQVLSARLNLALTLKSQGDLSGAADLERSALETRERVLGQEHPDTLTARNNLAQTLKAQGDLSGAAELQRSVLEASERLLGQEHPSTLTGRLNLAGTLFTQGDLSGAADLQRSVLEARERVLGQEHPDTLTARNNLAQTLKAQGDLSSAADLQRSVLEASERVLGQEHPDTLTARLNLAQALFAQGDLSGAADLQRSVLKARERLLGQEHPNTTIAAWNYFTTLVKLERVQPAKLIFQNSLSWLLQTDQALGRDQATIRGYLQRMLEATAED